MGFNPLETLLDGLGAIQKAITNPLVSAAITWLMGNIKEYLKEQENPLTKKLIYLGLIALKAFETEIKELVADTDNDLDDEFISKFMGICDQLIEEFGLTPIPN